MIAATPGYDLRDGAGGIGRPRALLFDWDNTLVDNWDVITDAMNAVYDAFGMPRWTIEEAITVVFRAAALVMDPSSSIESTSLQWIVSRPIRKPFS